MATRAGMRRPGTLERVFGGVGGTFTGGLLAGVAAAVVGSVLVDSLFDIGLGDSGLFDIDHDDDPFDFGGFDGLSTSDQGARTNTGGPQGGSRARRRCALAQAGDPPAPGRRALRGCWVTR